MVFIWEYFITISEEAKYFWKRKLTGASAIFFLNRYVPLTLYVLDFAGYASMSDEVSRSLIPPYTLLIPLVRGLRHYYYYGIACTAD